MKRTVLVTLFAVALNFIHAQDTTHTLIKLSRPQYLGIYIAPEFQMGQLGGSFTSIGGASAMLIVNKKTAIGVTAQMSLADNFSPANIKPLYLQAGFGGVKLEYTPRPDAAIHATFPLVVGAGFAQTDSASFGNNGGNRDFNFDKKNHGEMFDNQYFVIQPGIALEGNLIRYAKFFVGANYRISVKNSTSTTSLTTNPLQGISVNIGAKIGLFDFHIPQKKS